MGASGCVSFNSEKKSVESELGNYQIGDDDVKIPQRLDNF